MNLPIYRAKKIDSNDYVEGYYKPEDSVSQLFVNRKEGNYIMTLVSDCDYRDCEIDPTTLAIHFPDMLDSQGNKIFASLSEDGKGGDITETKDGWKVYKRVHLLLSDATRVSQDLDILEILSKKYNSVLDIKIIGIQE